MSKTLPFTLLSVLTLIGSNTVFAGKIGWRSVDGIEGLNFRTEVMTGVFVARDHRSLGKGFGRHGVRELTYKGVDLSAPASPAGGRRRHHGILNLYRVYSSTDSFGSLRDEQAELEKLPEGARLTWPASSDRPVGMTGTWRITGPAQIDVLIEARPSKAMTNFEILTASYLPLLMSKFVYLEGAEGPVPFEVRPSEAYGDPRNYPFFALGEEARAAQEHSGRIHSNWKWESIVPPEVAVLPIIFAEDASLQVVLMADPDSISGVCATPTPFDGDPEDWSSVEQHSALYFSLFGSPVEAGVTYTARIRLQVIDKPVDVLGMHLRLYQEFLADTF